MTPFEKDCYGMAEADIRKDYMNGLTARISGLEMVLVGMLSDCQHMVEHGFNPNDTRQMLNRAKYILIEMMTDKRN